MMTHWRLPFWVRRMRGPDRKPRPRKSWRLTTVSKSRYVSGYSLALVRLGLGDKERAIDALEQAYRNGEGADIYIIRVDPFLDELRGHPRFEALAEKIVPAREFAKAATTSK